MKYISSTWKNHLFMSDYSDNIGNVSQFIGHILHFITLILDIEDYL